MILVFMTDGNCIEVEAAVGADRKFDSFVCFDGSGREVASFPFDDVYAYTLSDGMSKVLKEEVCDELTLIPNQPEAPNEDGNPSGRGSR